MNVPYNSQLMNDMFLSCDAWLDTKCNHTKSVLKCNMIQFKQMTFFQYSRREPVCNGVNSVLLNEKKIVAMSR